MTMALLKQIDSFDHRQLLDAYNSIESLIKWTEAPHGRQAGLQYKQGEDPWSSAVGRLKSDEPAYTTTNPVFENTIFEELIKKYNMHRTRLMWINPFSCYSFHNDHSPRVHFPLITNQDCLFAFKTGTLKHFPAGEVWWVDTRFKHTFLNTSKEHRLHLVGVVNN